MSAEPDGPNEAEPDGAEPGDYDYVEVPGLENTGVGAVTSPRYQPDGVTPARSRTTTDVLQMGLSPASPSLWVTKTPVDQRFRQSGRGDLNPRPQRPERCALELSTPWSGRERPGRRQFLVAGADRRYPL